MGVRRAGERFPRGGVPDGRSRHGAGGQSAGGSSRGALGARELPQQVRASARVHGQGRARVRQDVRLDPAGRDAQRRRSGRIRVRPFRETPRDRAEGQWPSGRDQLPSRRAGAPVQGRRPGAAHVGDLEPVGSVPCGEGAQRRVREVAPGGGRHVRGGVAGEGRRRGCGRVRHVRRAGDARTLPRGRDPARPDHDARPSSGMGATL